MQFSWPERWQELLKSQENLTPSDITWTTGEIFTGQNAAEVLNAALEQMYRYATPINIPDRAVDLVSTGLAESQSLNISTLAAIVTTAAGARVVTHASRELASTKGGADLLEALGVNINITGAGVAEIVRRIGIGFCYAPIFHPVLSHTALARAELAVPTILDLLEALANPAKPAVLSVGVAKEEHLSLIANLMVLRSSEGFVFRSDDGSPQLSLATPSTVYQVADGEIRIDRFDPTNLGIESASYSDFAGLDLTQIAKKSREILTGKESAAKNAVTLNAAAGIAAFKADFGLSIEQQLANGLVMARQAIESGAAMALLESWAQLSQDIALIHPADLLRLSE